MPNARIVRAVCRTAETLPGWPDVKVLDLSCGDGHVIEALARKGCCAEGTHFKNDDYIFKNPSAALKTARIHKGVNLCAPLPFADESYDLVLATEVVEHLSDHAAFCAEVGRIVKTGGHFIFSTPNIHRLSSRIQFMLAGQHDVRSARLGWNIPPDELYATHHNPIYFPVFHTLLHHHRLHVERLIGTRWNAWNVLLAPLYPAVATATVMEARHAIKRSRVGGLDLLRLMLDFRMVFCEKIMGVAKKTEC